MPAIIKCPMCTATVLVLEVPSTDGVIVDFPPENRWCRVTTGGWGLLESYRQHGETCIPVKRKGNVLQFKSKGL